MKKLMAFATAAAVAASMAIPTFASAQFTDAGVPVSGIALETKGSFSFSGGTNCTGSSVRMTFSQTSATTGLISAFEVTDLSKCEVTGTLKALGCATMSGAVAENTPWVVHTNTSVLTITGFKVKFSYVEHNPPFPPFPFCPKTVTISGEVTATPNNTAAVSTVALSGTLTSSLGTNVTVGGTQEVQGSAKGTYGI